MTIPAVLNGMMAVLLAKFLLNDVPHAVGLIGGSSHLDNPTDRQTRYITQLSMQLGIRTPLEERPETQGDAGRLIRELEAERDRRKRIKSANPKATGNCFPDAGRFVTKHEEGTLVHGTVRSNGKRIDHAWVEVSPEYIWEPQTKQYMTKEAWVLNKPIEEARYDWEQAAVNVLKYKNWGPWT